MTVRINDPLSFQEYKLGMGLIPIIDGNNYNRDMIEEPLVDFLRSLSLTNHKRRDEVAFLLKADGPPDKVSGIHKYFL